MQEIKTLYLNVCAHCHPFDDQQNLRSRLETDAIYLILHRIEKIGVLETAHFLALKNQDRLESVVRHQQWQANLAQDAFFDQVFGE